jgi:amino acid transporter
MKIAGLFDFILGKYLATSEEGEQRIGPVAGIPMLGLDALSSSAYGPEAAATVLLSLGLLGTQYVLPISLAIIALLTIVYFSYRQTIDAYPSGGGSYTVAHENLGTFAGLLAAAALMLDYILVVAVGISAGVGALISAIPALQSYTLLICLLTLLFITLVNLRGVKEAGAAFMIPTYLFVGSLLSVICYGLYKTAEAHGHPVPVVHIPEQARIGTETLSLWLLARAFASGCTAMTGVEAVSNGVKAFRDPVTQNAKRTLTLIIFILIVLLAGIAYLAQSYGIGATDPGAPGYESLISQVVAAIVGRGFIYYVTLGSVIAVLALSANTGFADFPRMCQLVSRNGYLPQAFSERGRRLVFTFGILTISILSAVLLIIFGGVTDRLIPLFAIGAFLAFTLSQSGMVVHWLKQKGARAHAAIWINGLGALTTLLTLLVIVVSKFLEGGWITFIIIPGMLSLFYATRRHYVGVAKQVSCRIPLSYKDMRPPIVIVPIRSWSRMTRKALQFAMHLSPHVYGVNIESENGDISIEEQWKKYVIDPALLAGAEAPTLVIRPSPYRKLFRSLLDFIDEIEKADPKRQVAIVIPSLVENKWYHYLLHNQRAMLLRAVLRIRGDQKVVVVTVPWYLSE